MKHYIISYKPEEKKSVLDALEKFQPKSFSLLERIAVSVPDEKIESLLETLSNIPDIKYREAAVHTAYDRRKPNT